MDIRTRHVSTNKDYVRLKETQVFKGYYAGQLITFKLPDIGRIEAFTGRLLKTEISARR